MLVLQALWRLSQQAHQTSKSRRSAERLQRPWAATPSGWPMSLWMACTGSSTTSQVGPQRILKRFRAPVLGCVGSDKAESRAEFSVRAVQPSAGTTLALGLCSCAGG